MFCFFHSRLYKYTYDDCHGNITLYGAAFLYFLKETPKKKGQHSVITRPQVRSGRTFATPATHATCCCLQKRCAAVTITSFYLSYLFSVEQITLVQLFQGQWYLFHSIPNNPVEKRRTEKVTPSGYQRDNRLVLNLSS